MSSPPERSWMLATPIGSSASAGDESAVAAMAAAVPVKNVLRCMLIALLSPLPRCLSDQVFFEDRCADRVFRIDHVAEPDASGLAEQHVGVDLVKTVFAAHPADQFAIGDAGGIFQRPRAADRHHEIFGLQPG